MFKIAPGNFSQPLGHLSRIANFITLFDVHCGLNHRSTRRAPYSVRPVPHPFGAMFREALNMFKIAPGNFSQPADDRHDVLVSRLHGCNRATTSL